MGLLLSSSLRDHAKFCTSRVLRLLVPKPAIEIAAVGQCNQGSSVYRHSKNEDCLECRGRLGGVESLVSREDKCNSRMGRQPGNYKAVSAVLSKLLNLVASAANTPGCANRSLSCHFIHMYSSVFLCFRSTSTAKQCLPTDSCATTSASIHARWPAHHPLPTPGTSHASHHVVTPGQWSTHPLLSSLFLGQFSAPALRKA